MNKTFKDLGLSNDVVEAIYELGFSNPTETQAQIIPPILEGFDVIGQAGTGTGKTLSFAASILSKIDYKKKGVKAIVLTPTRELALQVSKEFKSLNINASIDILAVYGGENIERQINFLTKGIDIVVGTPGRVMDLMNRKKLNLHNLDFFILDEADEMLNMGFLEDITTILKETKEDKQVLMLSATMPNEIKKLATNYMKENHKIIKIKEESATAATVEQNYYLVNEKYRLEVLCRVLDSKKIGKSIIFCQTKKECTEALESLQARGYSIEAIHGDITQSIRIKTLERFKKGLFTYLIATDVAARGIHVDNVDLVVNYRLPYEYESYIHRIGRTGRANNTGLAITLITHKEKNQIKRIEKLANCKIIEKPLPESKEIVTNKYLSTIEKANEIIKDNSYQEALEYVRDLNKGDLINLSAALLKYNVNKEIGSDMLKKLEIKDKTHVKNIDKDKTRVFLTIGKKDNVKKGSLLDYIKKETNLNKDYFTNIDVLNTYTFIDVDSKVLDKFIDALKGHKWKDRAIRIEKAKRK